jgi:hypothetical protein
MNASRPQRLVQAVEVTTPIESPAFVADRAAELSEKSEPGENKLDRSSDRNTAAGEPNTEVGLVNENNFLFLFPLALGVVLVIFGLALSMW